MSGILIRVKGASFADNAVAFAPPIADGLEYWNFFGGDDARTKRNLAPGKANGTLIGAPTYNANSVVFNPRVNYIQTDVADGVDMTFIAVSKPLTDAQTILISSLQGPRPGATGTSNGKSLYYASGASGSSDNLVQAIFSTSRWDGISSATTLVSSASTQTMPLGEWRAISGRSSQNSSDLKVYGTVLGEVDVLTQQPDLTTAKYQIGSSTTGASVPVEIAFAAIYSRALLDNELTKVYDFLRGYYARRNIAI